MSGGGADAGDLLKTRHHLSERGDLLLDPGLDIIDVLGQGIDTGQHLVRRSGLPGVDFP